jgi:hypothetical protein
MTVNETLVKIQKELKAPKSQKNNFGNYNYRSCEDILEAVKPYLGEFALLLTDEMVEVGGRIYVKAVAELTDGKEAVSVQAFARESETKKGMDESQITGAASSYARKYALNGLFCIDDTKDADTQDNSKVEAKKPVKAVTVAQSPTTGIKLASEKQVKMISYLLDEKGQKDEDLKAKYHVQSKKDLTSTQASMIIENLLKLPNVKEEGLV